MQSIQENKQKHVSYLMSFTLPSVCLLANVDYILVQEEFLNCFCSVFTFFRVPTTQFLAKCDHQICVERKSTAIFSFSQFTV